MSTRPERVAQFLKEELSQIIREELKDPRIGFVTITRVDITADLRYARIYVSIMGEEKEKKKTFKGLESARGFMKRIIGDRIRMRYTPEIVFKIDDSIEYNIHLSKIMEGAKKTEAGGQAQ